LRLAPARGNAYAFTAAFAIICGSILTPMARNSLLDTFGVTGRLLEPLAPVVLAFGYGVTILWAAGYTAAKPLLARFAPVERMAFSNYIGVATELEKNSTLRIFTSPKRSRDLTLTLAALQPTMVSVAAPVLRKQRVWRTLRLLLKMQCSAHVLHSTY
jgi:hypothetical protein